MKALLILAIAAVATHGAGAAEAAPSHAADSDSLADAASLPLDSIDRAVDLNEVVITGTLTPKSLKNSPVQTRVISSADLRRADATNLQDLLQQELPGVEFSYAMNQQVNMNLAGFSGLGVLVLVDGERLAGETMDNVDFSRLPMNNVERVEIIRGAASALYGSNAAGGVINIITKKPDRDWAVSLDGRSGSHGEWRAAATFAAHHRRIANTLNVSFNRMGSFDVCLNSADDCDFRRVNAYRAWNFSDRLSFSVIDGLDLSARVGYYFKESDYNPDMPSRYRAFSGGARGSWRISTCDNLEISYIFDQYDKSDYIKAHHLDLRDYSNVQHTVKAMYNHTFRESDILTIGGDLTRDWLSSYQFADGETHHQFTADLLAQYDWRVSARVELVGAVRWDWFSDMSMSRVTPKLSARWRLADVTLRGGYSGGFRAPSLKEKYMRFNMADIFDIHGNPDLKPEISHNFNLSAEYSWREYYFMLAGNYNLITDKIATSGILYDADRNPYIDYLNVEDLKVFGIDATIKAKWPCGISASLSYNFTHEETHGGSVTQYCPARPHSLNAVASWHKSLRTGIETDISLSGRLLSSVSYESMYMYEPFESREITNPAYTIWKARVAQRIFGGVTISATIDNLLNYRPKVYTFNAPVTTGTTFQIGISLEIDKLKLWKH